MDLSHDPHRGLIDELDVVHHKASPQKFTNQGSFLNRRWHRAARAEALIDDEHSPDRFARLVNESIQLANDQNSLPPDPTIITNNNSNLHEKSLAPSWLSILLVAPLIVVLLVWLLILLRRRFRQTQNIHLVNQNKINTCVDVNQQVATGQVFQHFPHQNQAASNSQGHLYKQHNKQGDKTKLNTAAIANSKSRSSKPSTHHKTHNAHYLLGSSSSGTSTSSNSITSSTGGGSQAASPTGYNNSQPNATTTSTNTPISSSGKQLRFDNQNFSPDLLSPDPMRSLLDHMHLYLLTLTYQEIIACVVAFTIAILNIVRMRNLFCCNLIIFILITSKLFNLLTLTTFSLTKLVKLFNLKVYTSVRSINTNQDTNSRDEDKRSKSHPCRHHHRQEGDQERVTLHTDDKKSEDSLIDRNTSSSYSSSSSSSTSSTTTTATPAATASKALKHNNKSIDEPQTECSNNSGDKSALKSKNQQSQKQHSADGQNQLRRSSSPYDTNATICRLIDKDDNNRCVVDEVSSEIIEEPFCFSAQDFSCADQNNTKPEYINNLTSSNRLGSRGFKSTKNSPTIGEPIVCRLILIAAISSTLGLVCLYLRLIPLSGPLLLNLPDNFNRSSPSGQDWSISIYAPSTTTEASTRYSSLTNDENKTIVNNNNYNQNSQQQQQPNYQATWSARFQQSSQLKHLIDQYELQNFITLLSDTHLQTSRFMCTLAANNYAPFAKLSMITLYASLMLLILILSIVIQQVGRRKLRQFELAYLSRGLSTMPTSSVLLANYPSWLNYNKNYHNYMISDSHMSTFASAVAATELPMSSYGNASQQKSTDSNQKRYSQLLKQNMAKQQQSSFDIYSSAALRRLHQRQQSRKTKLRNSSSLSSLLVTPTMIAEGHLDELANGGSTFSASVDRYPAAQLQNSNKPYRHYHYQQQQQQAISRQTHLRRLISAQSMCNLAPSSTQQAPQQQMVANSKVPAGKLASSGGQLAWLPLGSAATVASLSNIGRDPPTSTMEESEEDSWSRQLIATRLKLTDINSNFDRQRVCNRRTTGDRERLGSIGEHLVDCTSTLDERCKKETAIESDLCGKNINRLHGKNGMRGRISKKTTPNIETTAANATLTTKLNELSSPPSTSSSALVSSHSNRHQQQQLKQRTGSWALYSNQHESYKQNQYRCQKIDQHDGLKNRLNYAELKRDLRLSQSVILFGQLLNHAPILLLLAIANFAPDGLIAGWNSSHDNGFVWLTLIEAFLFPLFLCTLDPSLTFALKRSLRCTNMRAGFTSRHSTQMSTTTSAAAAAAASGKVNKLANGKSQQQLASARFNFNASSINTAAVVQQQQAQVKGRQYDGNSDLILGPSASYPDFMFACQRNNSNNNHNNYRIEGYTGLKFLSSSQSSAQRPTAVAVNKQQTDYQSLTGPPYLAKQYELNIDTADDSLRANFALMSKSPLRNLAMRSNFIAADPSLNCSLVGTSDLLASRRARYSEFVSGGSRRKLRTSALLSATKRLLRLSSKPQNQNQNQKQKQKQQQQRRQRSISACLPQVAATSSSLSFGYSISNSSTTDTNGKPSKHQSSAAGGRISPTSSLSTLIRKFNHDNYTNVCQQYEQRKQQIAVQKHHPDSLERRHNNDNNNKSRNASSAQVAVVLDNSDQVVNSKTEVLIDGLDGGGTTGSGKVEVFSKQQNREKERQRNLLLVDEDGIFCRKGGLYYNYCLDDQTTLVENTDSAILRNLTDNSETSRVNPMLQVTELKERTNNFNLASNSGPSFDAHRATSERCLLDNSFDEQQRQREQSERTQVDLSKERFVRKEQQASDDNAQSEIEVKDLAAIKSKRRKNSTSTTIINTYPSKTDIVLPGELNENKQNMKQNSNSSNNNNNNNETIISNITSVQELLNKMNGMMEKQQETSKDLPKSFKGLSPGTGGGGGRSSTSSSGFESSSKQSSTNATKSCRNNKTILEMVAKKNNDKKSSLAKQSDTCANQVRQLTAAIASSAKQQQVSGSSFFDNSSSNHFNCSTLDGGNTLDYASLRSVEDALSLASVSSEFEYHNINHGICQQHQALGLEEKPISPLIRDKQNDSITASTSTTIAVESSSSESVSSSNSTLSLKLSADSEFRIKLSSELEQKSTTNDLMISSLAFSSSNHPPQQANNKECINTNSNGSSGSRRLEDLRFPSFLPTKSQPSVAGSVNSAPDSAAVISKQQLKPPKGRLIGQSINKLAESQKSASNISPVLTSGSNYKTNSSSLLNLTTTKFSVLNDNNNDENGTNLLKQQQHCVSKQQLSGQNCRIVGKLQIKTTGPNNTITKQKRGATNDHIVTLTEFDSSSYQSSNQCESSSNGNRAECSLPSESGNVRARIRKMEQQQSSTPNPANSSQAKLQQQQQQQQQHQASALSANNRTNQQQQRRGIAQNGSMIPVTSFSRLPVPLASSNVQLAAIKSGANSTSIQSKLNQTQLSSASSSSNVEYKNHRSNLYGGDR